MGTKLKLSADDDHQVARILHRALVAFLSHSVLLKHAQADRSSKLKMFSSLVTASIRWLRCILRPTRPTFHKLLVHQATLVSWLLRVTVHWSNPSPDGIPLAQHAVKLWVRVYMQIWDELLASCVWDWAGHVFRQPCDDLLLGALLSFRSSHRVNGARGLRRGPQNVGHKTLLTFLAKQGIPHDAAHDRLYWQSLKPEWLAHCGCTLSPCGFPMRRPIWVRGGGVCRASSLAGRSGLQCAGRSMWWLRV